MAVNRFGLVFLGLLLHNLLPAQNNQEKVSISFQGLGVAEALLQLDEVTEKRLSFNPQILPDKTLNEHFDQTTPETILRVILGEGYDLKSIGDYLIILKKKALQKTKTSFRIEGGITDAETGEQLEDVSIYEVNTLRSTISDQYGNFKLKARTIDLATFAISKAQYVDTIIYVDRLETFDGTIKLKRRRRNKTLRVFREQATSLSRSLVNIFTSDKNRLVATNVGLVDRRLAQLSLVPGLGTNLKLGSQITNSFSMNMIAGYAYGVKGVEIGGVYNIDREEVKGFQVAGVGNTVGGEVKGVQVGGAINTTQDFVKGIQIAGVINVASDSVRGLQISGVSNKTKQLRGLQIGGLSNHTRDMTGLTIAGAANTSRNLKGVQISGFVNTANRVRGMQLGVINIADSVDSGIQLGILNFSRNGLLSPLIYADEVQPFNAALRTGLNYFYTILSVGINPDEYWSYGMGFGSKLFLAKGKKVFLNPELENLNLQDANGSEGTYNMRIRFQLKLGYQLFKRLAFSGGPSINYLLTNDLDEAGNPVLDIANNPFYTREGSTFQQMWIGYSFGISF